MASASSTLDPLRVRFGEFELDEANALLLRDGRAVALAPTPFNLLCTLARQPGALLTKDALLDAVWGHQFVSDSVLKTAISDLRIALGDSAREPRVIETVSRRGYRFIAAPAAAALTPSPPSEELPHLSSSFVGRADVVARLQRAWDRACSGQRALVWVAGEPGIGKTSVIEHFVATLGGAVCARGQCVEHYGSGEPYLPVLEAVAELCRRDPALPGLMRSVAPTWLLQLPWLMSAEERDALRRELTGVGSDRMLREMGELLDRYTEQRPLLLITEDLHWSDRATIQLIDHIARRRGRACLMWLASFRAAEVVAQEHPLNPLRRELRLHQLCDEVVLDPFSEAEVAACVAQRSRSLARNEAFVQALHERTEGLPLFVSTVISEVMEPADDDATIQARLAAVAVPESLVAIIDHYIARLDAGQRALLSAAAVCGVEFRVGTVSSVVGQDEASVSTACDELVRQHVWLTAPRAHDGGGALDVPYAFRHALVRQVLYERTPATVRVQLHRDVGMALERERAMGGTVAPAELALHFDRGRQPLVALRYSAEAAEAALLNFSPTGCLDHAERAVTLLQQAPEGPERDALEITLATLQGVAAFQVHGVGRGATTALQRAYALLPGVASHPMRGHLLHGFGYLLALRAEYAQALKVAERAETLASGSNDPMLMLAACFLHAHVRHLRGEAQVARSWMDRGLAIAETLDLGTNQGWFAADPLVTLLGMRAIDLVRSGLVSQCRAHVQRARERAAQLRHPMTRLVAAWYEALLEVRLGDADRVAMLANEMQTLVDEFSLTQGRTACGWFRGWAEARKDRPREGYRLIREALEQNIGLGMRAGSSEVLGYAAEALLLAGDGAAAQAQLQEALKIADELGEGVYMPQLLLLEADIARAMGRPEAGAACAERAIEEARVRDSPWFELHGLVDLCEPGGAGADDRQAVRALVERSPEAADTDLVQRARALGRSGR